MENSKQKAKVDQVLASKGYQEPTAPPQQYNPYMSLNLNQQVGYDNQPVYNDGYGVMNINQDNLNEKVKSIKR